MLDRVLDVKAEACTQTSSTPKFCQTCGHRVSWLLIGQHRVSLRTTLTSADSSQKLEEGLSSRHLDRFCQRP